MDQEAQLQEWQEELAKLRGFVQSEGYRYMLDWAEGQVELRTREITLNRLSSLHDVPAQEFEKGELSGIRLFTKLPEMRIEELKEQIEHFVLEEEEDDGRESTGTDDGDSGNPNTGTFVPAI